MSKLVLAQVKGGRPFSFRRSGISCTWLTGTTAAAGIFITLGAVTSTQARAEARNAGVITVGADRCPRVQLWSIEDYFNGKSAQLPTLADPNTGRPIQPALLRVANAT